MRQLWSSWCNLSADDEEWSSQVPTCGRAGAKIRAEGQVEGTAIVGAADGAAKWSLRRSWWSSQHGVKRDTGARTAARTFQRAELTGGAELARERSCQEPRERWSRRSTYGAGAHLESPLGIMNIFEEHEWQETLFCYMLWNEVFELFESVVSCV